MKPDRQLIGRIVTLLVAAVHPLRIILFGSAARGAMGADSDLDLLVVMKDGTHRRRTAQKLYVDLYGVGIATDVVVATESDLELHRNNPGLVYKRALDEGKEIYHAGE